MIQLLDLAQLVHLMSLKKLHDNETAGGKKSKVWIHSCHKIAPLCSKPSLSLLITTNKLVKKHDAAHEQKRLTDKQSGHSGRWWFIWDPPQGDLVLLHAVPAIDLTWRPYARLPPDQTQTQRSRVTRSVTSSGLFAIGWWSVTSRLIDRWVKSMLLLARREIMADEITTVPEGGKWKMIEPTRTTSEIWQKSFQVFEIKKQRRRFSYQLKNVFSNLPPAGKSFHQSIPPLLFVWQKAWSLFASLHSSALHPFVSLWLHAFTPSLYFSVFDQSSPPLFAPPLCSPQSPPAASVNLFHCLPFNPHTNQDFWYLVKSNVF